MPNQSFGASFRLDIGLANEAAILILLLAQMGGERCSRFADRLEARLRPSRLELGREHRGAPPLAQHIGPLLG